MAKRILRLLKTNGGTLLWFEIQFKLCVCTLMLPFLRLYFRYVMRLAGYRYLTTENFLPFFRNPVTIIAVVLLLLLAAIYTLIDIAAVVYLLDQSAQGRRVQVQQVLRFSLRTALRVFRWKNLLMLPYLLLLIPILNIGAAFGVIATAAIPKFVGEFFTHHRALTAGLIVLYLGLVLLSLRWLYALHGMILGGLPFPEACRQSVRLSLGHRFEDLGCLLAVQLLLSALNLAVMALGFLLIVWIFKLLSGATGAGVTSAVLIFFGVTLVVFAALSMPISYAVVGILLEQRTQQTGATPYHSEAAAAPAAGPKRQRIHRIIGAAILVLFFAAAIVYVYADQRGRFNLNVEELRTTEISAHRGASADYPENTMAAFYGAWEQHADWIELDVHQSSDGVIYVMHDTSFKRTTGLNRRCWELSWAEIRELDAGSFFSRDFAGEPIPSLEEVIEFARWRGLRLNIEIKPTGHETELERQVVELIREADFEDDCVVTSQSYVSLERVKACNPEITTVYVMAVAVGELERLRAADAFSIESGFVTKKLVSSIHADGKQIYAWTVDSEDRIERMIRLGVDNLITNEVALAKECVNTSRTSGLVQRLLEYFLDG